MDVQAIALNSAEIFLVRWLAVGPGHKGECEGPSLDTLVGCGLAEAEPDRPGYMRLTADGYDVATQAGGPYDGTAGG